MSKKIFIANWKMQLNSIESVALARSVARALKKYQGEVVVCPDYLSMSAVANTLQGGPVLLGAQDAAAYERGAYTGEVAACDLALLGVKYVLIGHSERRSYLQEEDKLLAAKIKMVVASKMIPVLCVGENAAERKKGKTAQVIKSQLKGTLQFLSASELKSVLIAYEPVWSISTSGTGLVCTPVEALRVKTLIIEWCLRIGLKKVRVLYGGSVNPDNISAFLKDFDGFLVGGASLKADSFSKIVNL